MGETEIFVNSLTDSDKSIQGLQTQLGVEYQPVNALSK